MVEILLFLVHFFTNFMSAACERQEGRGELLCVCVHMYVFRHMYVCVVCLWEMGWQDANAIYRISFFIRERRKWISVSL